MMVYISTKFHENILNGIRVMKRTRKVNRGTDGRMDKGHDIIQPIFDGHINMPSESICYQNRRADEHIHDTQLI